MSDGLGAGAVPAGDPELQSQLDAATARVKELQAAVQLMTRTQEAQEKAMAAVRAEVAAANARAEAADAALQAERVARDLVETTGAQVGRAGGRVADRPTVRGSDIAGRRRRRVARRWRLCAASCKLLHLVARR